MIRLLFFQTEYLSFLTKQREERQVIFLSVFQFLQFQQRQDVDLKRFQKIIDGDSFVGRVDPADKVR